MKNAIILSSLLVMALAYADPGNGRLTLVTDSPARVSIDGKPMGKTPVKRMSVTPGRHMVTYSSKALGSQYEFEIRVKPDKHTTCTYSFETGENRCEEEGAGAAAAKTALTLSSKPAAEVSIDGKTVGMTPMETFEVAPGHYKLEFKASGFKSVTKEVDVSPAETVRVEVTLEPARE